jgi:uncharacterized protein YbjT (DUF2867 family)
MKVLVIGGTRGIGHAVVVAAHAAGHTLTVMARNAAAFAGPVSGLRLVAGDAADATDVDRAVAGQEAIVWTVGAAGVLSRGTAYLLASMQIHRVSRLVCVTYAASDSGVTGQETLIRASAAEWTIVRPSAMTHGKATGLYQAVTAPPSGRQKRIPRDDVADFIVESLSTPDYLHKTVYLAG